MNPVEDSCQRSDVVATSLRIQRRRSAPRKARSRAAADHLPAQAPHPPSAGRSTEVHWRGGPSNPDDGRSRRHRGATPPRRVHHEYNQACPHRDRRRDPGPRRWRPLDRRRLRFRRRFRRRTAGTLQQRGRLEAKGKPDNGRIDVEFEVDSNRVGQTWSVRIADKGVTVFQGTRRTAAPSGSFSVERPVPNRGRRRRLQRRRNSATGQRCTGSVRL